MKTGKKRRCAVSNEIFEKMKFKFDATYKEFREVITAVNTIRASLIVEHEEGHNLPNNLGRVIILKRKTNRKKLYSMTRPGVRIYNHHSFGFVYKVHHKDRILMRYPELYKFRPHRKNIKMPLKDYIDSGEKEYYHFSDYYN